VGANTPERRNIAQDPVECDGWEFHHDREAFEADRERDADHLDHGLITIRITIRITKTRLQQTPHDEAARLLRILNWARAALPR
jgi:hypothetical protein